ncbi:MAG: Hsp20/alpha crystallin family protein [Spirochaetota bacterium]|nr:Hsp20/alpha crystallin family protein [Spirochaetota bacterium]
MNWNIAKRNRNNNFGMDLFRRNITNIFDDFFSLRPTTLFESEWIPTIDMEEDDKMIHIKAEMPGMDEKDLKVTIENNLLTLNGEKKTEKDEEDKDKRYHYTERRFGSFSRSIPLPEGVKSDKVKASFKKGVLKIEIPKDESKQPKKININVN